MTDYQLSEGALQKIFDGESYDKPKLQLLGYKKVPGGQDRYRMLVSDGVLCHPYAMLGSQLNDRLNNGEFERYAIVILDKFSCTEMQPGKKIMIMLELTLVAKGEVVKKKIGNPQQYAAKGEGTNQPAQNGTTNGNHKPELEEPKSAPAPPPRRDPSPVPVKNEPYSGSNSLSNLANRKPEETIKKEPYSGSNSVDNIPNKKPAENSFYGNQNASKYNPVRPPANGPNTSNNIAASGTEQIHPIASLSPYQNKWTIKARVTSKQNIRTWSNSKGEGRLFSMDLCDESGEIRATVFTDQVDRFYNMMEVNKVYTVTKAHIKTANKRFSSIRHDYELTFSNDTIVIECNSTVDSIPMVRFDFKEIASLQNIEPSTMVDVIGVCKSCSEIQTITKRDTNTELKKRDIHLMDKSLSVVTLALWGERALNFDGSSNPVVAIKGSRLSDYGGRSLSATMNSTIMINPDIREAHALRGWYDREGVHSNAKSLTVSAGMSSATTAWKTFAQVNAEQLGHNEKPDYFTTKAMITLIKKENCMYQSCPKEGCNKKVQDLQDGNFRCDKCQIDYPNHSWRLLVNMNIADFSDSIWATSFQENSEVILGCTAAELGHLKLTDDNAFEEVISNAQFKSYIFKFRAKAETYNEETRVKFAVINVTPMNYVQYGQKLLGDVKKFEESFFGKQ